MTAGCQPRKQRQATHDSLTGLCNRIQLHTKIAQAIQQSSDGFALMLLDLDRFKEINDALGHQSGDELLKEIGPRIQAHLPHDTCIARLGGDEFAILLPGVKQPDASLAHAVTLGTMVVEISASQGIAHYPQHGTDAGDLLRHADIAMQPNSARTPRQLALSPAHAPAAFSQARHSSNSSGLADATTDRSQMFAVSKLPTRLDSRPPASSRISAPAA